MGYLCLFNVLMLRPINFLLAVMAGEGFRINGGVGYGPAGAGGGRAFGCGD